VARRRPLVDAMTIRRGSRKGQVIAKLREETRRRLERLGHERALIYKTLVLTGLRKGELASITVGQLALDADPPRLRLAARDAKNRHEATIPLRADVAADLRQWLAEKASAHQEAAGESQTVRFDPNHQKPSQRHLGDSEGREGQMCQALTAVPPLPANTPLFTVPRDLVRILDRDLKLAKIPKQDELGRTVDVHAMRHSFATHLAKTGAFPRTAQAAMWHSDVNLTMGAHTPTLACSTWPCNGHQRFDPAPVCTKVCTNPWQTVQIAVIRGQNDGGREGRGRSRPDCRKCLRRQ
jgi:integrase